MKLIPIAITTIVLSILASICTNVVIEEIVKRIQSETKCQKFYDGEGNEIPVSVVDLYVKSHFVHMTEQEKDSINKYFYVNQLK